MKVEAVMLNGLRMHHTEKPVVLEQLLAPARLRRDEVQVAIACTDPHLDPADCDLVSEPIHPL